MDYKITLIAASSEPDGIGAMQQIETKREIWCLEEGLQQSEHVAAGQVGFRPSFRVSVWDFEYNGEKSALYRGRTFSIYRAYHRIKDGRIELYLGGKVAK